MHKTFALIFFITFLSSNLVFADEKSEQSQKDPPLWTKDRVFEELASPWTTKARTYLIVGTGSVLTLLAFKKQLIDNTQDSVSSRKPLGHWSTFGDHGGQMIPNALYVGGAFLLHDNDKAMLMFKSSLYSAGATTVLKNIIKEQRPNHADRYSFPSGHTTTAFAFASTVAQLHEWYWGTAAYLFAGFVGFSRINDNYHYLHDVAAGATIGAVYGIGVTEIYKKYLSKNNGKSSDKTAFNLMPIVDPEIKGLLVRYEF